jgi:hypothetical protein
MKKALTAIGVIVVGLALEGGLGASSWFAGLTARQQGAAAIGLAAVYLLGVIVLAVRHRAGSQRAEQRRHSTGWVR